MKNFRINVVGKLAIFSLLVCFFALPVSAQQGFVISPTVVQESIRQMDIMAGDSTGNLNLEKQVTRAEFATMLVAASPYKNVTTHFGYTLFTDVPSSHWASGYVKVVVEKGYMVGYLNGTFGPDRTVLVEEAVTAVLNLLGYDSTSLSGTYPQAQLAKFYELDMDEFMSVTAGQPMTREQCMYLFYNLMNTTALDGTPYASKMGYAVTATGALDTMALTTSGTQGPYIVGTAVLPTELAGVNNIYKNNKEATLEDLKHYDIVYYNSKLNTVWIYDTKVTGRLTEISSVQAPTAVTVSGITYSLETVDVIHKFSVGGQFQVGDMVTLMLGNQGMVADVARASDTEQDYIGVVLDRGVDHFSDSANSTTLGYYAQVVSTDGTVYQLDSTGKYYDSGTVVSVSYSGGGQSVSRLSTKSITGKVSDDGKTIGKYTLASDVEILEISGAEYKTVFPSRLAGYTLKDEDVIYYVTNEKGEIKTLLLEDVTGDLTYYALLTKVDEFDYGTYLSGYYTYYIEGQGVFHEQENKVFRVKKGAAILEYEDGVLDGMENIQSGELTSINGLRGVIENRQYLLADGYQVYENYDGYYKTTTLDQISDLTQYHLTGYYDYNLYSAGNQIRIILAERK